ncbi:MAG: hypothetical protein O7E53_05790 [Alphaproteobacteria bacterium]|nr:hypothetical protein [Alphaproteobacteria bacterium]
MTTRDRRDRDHQEKARGKPQPGPGLIVGIVAEPPPQGRDAHRTKHGHGSENDQPVIEVVLALGDDAQPARGEGGGQHQRVPGSRAGECHEANDREGVDTGIEVEVRSQDAPIHGSEIPLVIHEMELRIEDELNVDQISQCVVEPGPYGGQGEHRGHRQRREATVKKDLHHPTGCRSHCMDADRNEEEAMDGLDQHGEPDQRAGQHGGTMSRHCAFQHQAGYHPRQDEGRPPRRKSPGLVRTAGKGQKRDVTAQAASRSRSTPANPRQIHGPCVFVANVICTMPAKTWPLLLYPRADLARGMRVG